ncbi:MAG: ATP-binding protein, partial [Pseudomonadota bacterium]|nr:ATP-binding protein [Pseudomonadota bacterium]
NLIVNAAQAAADGDAAAPRVTVAAYQELGGDRPSVRIEICDNGFGVDPGQAERLFEPFFTTRPRGTGLGLAIVRRIVDQHHGRVQLDAQAAGGTCAVVSLPVGPIIEQDASGKAVDDDKPNLTLVAST